MTCQHDWKYHHGFLGYESSICSKCHLDYNDLKTAATTKYVILVKIPKDRWVPLNDEAITYDSMTEAEIAAMEPEYRGLETKVEAR